MSQTICTNPSIQRSFESNVLKSSKLNHYLKLTISTGSTSKDVLIFPGMEYNIIFYDGDCGSRKTIVGLVQDVYCNQIKVKEKKTYNCSTCKNRSCCNNSSTSCGCIYNPPDTSSYDDNKTYFIPINNIMGIDYVRPKNNNSNGVYIDEEEKFVLLGLSATTLHAVIVHIDLFTDDHPNAVKSIDLKKDNIYDIIYEVDNITYEITGRVVEIKQCAGETESYIVRSRENTGFDNRVYNNDASGFILSKPSVKNIKIVFDTSDDFSGSCETIDLASIRDCTLLIDNDTNDMIYRLDDETTFTVKNDVVSVTKNGNTTQIGVAELLNYYTNN